MKGLEATSLLLAILFVPAMAQAQGRLAAEVDPVADQIVCPLDELEWGIAQSFPDPWYSTPKVEEEPWDPGYETGSSPGPYTTIWMGKEMMSCRWKYYGKDSSSPYYQGDPEAQNSGAYYDAWYPRLYVQRPLADIPKESYPCPPTVQVKVLSTLPSPWLGTTYQWSLQEKGVGPGNYCLYGGPIPNEILRPVRTDYADFSANPAPPIDDFKQAFVVTKAELTAIPTQKTTTCPTTVRFEGRIHVNGSGQIRYRVEENGQVGPLKTIHADAAGGYALAWQSEVEAPEEPAAAGGLAIAPQPGNVATGRARLLIESPSDGVAESNEASYEITCSPLAPVGGLVQTPEETEPEPLGIAAPHQPPQEATPQIRRAAPQPEPVVEGGHDEMIHKLPARGAAPASADNALQAVVLLPDLRIRTATVDPSKPKEVKVRVANTGQAAAGATRVRVWIIPQGKAWYGLVPPLAPGQAAWTTVQTDMPVMSAQHVYARVDDPDKNKESDEGNNGHQLK